jgi:hypothetical protein
MVLRLLTTAAFLVACLYVRRSGVPVWKPLVGYGLAVFVLYLLFKQELQAALFAGFMAATLAALLLWVEDRFHSLATIPIWFVASALLLALLP